MRPRRARGVLEVPNPDLERMLASPREGGEDTEGHLQRQFYFLSTPGYRPEPSYMAGSNDRMPFFYRSHHILHRGRAAPKGTSHGRGRWTASESLRRERQLLLLSVALGHHHGEVIDGVQAWRFYCLAFGSRHSRPNYT